MIQLTILGLRGSHAHDPTIFGKIRIRSPVIRGFGMNPDSPGVTVPQWRQD